MAIHPPCDPAVGPAPTASVNTDSTDTSDRQTYRQIVRSSALIGGSSILNIVIGMVRTKAIAVLLGPAGFGMMGAFALIADLARSIAQLGINASGVRQIAEAAASGDADRLARTVIVLRRVAVACGVLGALLLMVFSSQVSTLTFGDDRQAEAVALLSLAVLFNLVAGGQGALLQGMRRIGDMAKVATWGALLGTLISVPLVYFMREDGVVPSLVLAAAVSILTSWWYSQQVTIASTRLTLSHVMHESAALMKLGLAFMASGFLMMGAAYVVRIILLRQVGMEAAGVYQAAWTIGGLYVGFILQALGTDFYPRLVGVSTDNLACNRLVNEQAHVSLLLAGPGVIATLTLAHFCIVWFYSDKFHEAVEILRWICLGMALRVITWPMGFIIVAKNRQVLFFLVELAWALVNLALTWIGVMWFGANGAGMAFFGSYVFHACMIYPVVSRLSGFRWSAINAATAIMFILSIGAVFSGFYIVTPLWATLFGGAMVILSTLYSAHTLVGLIAPDRDRGYVSRFLRGTRSVR